MLDVALAKVGLGAFSPGAHEPVIQTSTQRGTHQRNHAPRPLFYYFRTGTSGDALDDAGDKFIDDFLLHQLTADVDTGGTGGSNPKLCDLAIGIELKTVHQA